MNLDSGYQDKDHTKKVWEFLNKETNLYTKCQLAMKSKRTICCKSKLKRTNNGMLNIKWWSRKMTHSSIKLRIG